MATSNNKVKSMINGEEAVYCPITFGLIPLRCCPNICKNRNSCPQPSILPEISYREQWHYDETGWHHH